MQLSKYLFLLIYILFFLVLPVRFSLILLSFSVPLFSGLPSNYIVLAFIIISFFKHYKDFKFQPSYIVLLIIVFIEIFNYIYYKSNIVNVFSVLLSVLLIIYVFDSFENLTIDYKKLINYLMFGFVVLLLIIIANTIREYSFYDFITLKARLGVTKIGDDISIMKISLNPNALGAVLSFAISIVFIKIRKDGINIVSLMLIFMFLTLGFFTLSRTFLLSISLIFIIYFSTKFKLKTFFRFLCSIILLIAVFTILFPETFNYILTNYYSRFAYEDITSGRIDIFMDYNRIFISNIRYMFFGVGVDNYLVKYNYPYSAHNSLQEIFLVWGIVGFITFLVFLIHIIRKCIVRKRNDRIVFSLPLISIFLSSLAGQFFTSDRIYFMIVSLLFFLSTDILKNDKTRRIDNDLEKYQNG